MVHRYPEERWTTSSAPPSQSYVNGHDSLALGTTLGRLMHGQEQTIVILNRIDQRLERNGEAMVEVLQSMEQKHQSSVPPPAPPTAPPPPERQDRLTGRDWAQIILAIGLILTAAFSKTPIMEKVVPLILK